MFGIWILLRSVVRPPLLAGAAAAALVAWTPARAAPHRQLDPWRATHNPRLPSTASIPEPSPGTARDEAPPSDPEAALEVWPAFPPGIDQPAGATGMLGAIDPRTGRLTMPSADQIRGLDREPAPFLSQRFDDLPVIRLPDGTLMIYLQGRFQQYSVARLDPTGKLRLECVATPDLGLTRPAPASKPVEE